MGLPLSVISAMSLVWVREWGSAGGTNRAGFGAKRIALATESGALESEP